MIKEITIPKIGYTMEEGMVVKWLKKEGDTVKAGEPVLEIASDKANIEVEAPDDGVILKLLAEEGEYVPVLHAVALMGEEGDMAGEAAAMVEPQSVVPESKTIAAETVKDNTSGGNRLSPRARKFARDNTMDAEEIQLHEGTGYKGMIVERDLKKMLDIRAAAAPAASTPAMPTAGAVDYITPSNFKQVTAKRLTQSVQEIPQFFVGMDTEAENLLLWKSRIEDASGGRMSITAMLVKCVSCALRDHKEKANVSWDNGRIAVHPAIRMGVAVATDRGLVVPVIGEPDKKSLAQIDGELKTLSVKAREGKLSIEEMTGSTFTISNLGMYGADEFSAIINPPESAILAVGRTVKKAVVLKDDTVAVKPIMRLNLTVDHRVLDGADAARLLGTIKKYIEFPELML
jgi:pyruvate dehydrogenase E2 component (dihydrolipoamide acetyltransferase)